MRPAEVGAAAKWDAVRWLNVRNKSGRSAASQLRSASRAVS